MAFIDELMKLQGNQMGRTPIANPMMAPQPILMQPPQVAPQATPQATPQAPQAPQAPVVQGQVEPNFMSKLGSLFGGGSGGGAGLPQAFTPPSAGAVQAQERTDIAPVSLESLGLESPQQRVLQESAASGAIQDPFGVTQAQIEQAGNADFGKGTASPSLVPSGSLGTVPYDPTLPVPQVSQENIAGAQGPLAETIQPTAPTAFQSPSASGLATAGGQPLAEFLAGGQQLDPQGRMIDPSADRSFFEQQSAAREQRAAEQFGVARGPDARDRGVGELSMADAVDLAGGDRDKARAMVVASRQAPAGQTLTPEQQVARERLELDRAKFADSVIAREGAPKDMTASQKEFAKKAGEGAYDWDQCGRANAKENIDKFDGVIRDLKTGQLDTRTLVEFAPLVGDWARAAINPTGQQGLDTIRGVIFQGLRDTLGAQFTEREGERLVSASYNPKLDEASYIARLEPALELMRATFDAKEALTQHIINGGSVTDYKGQTPREVYDSFNGGSGGSPIQGDVDVASDADAILAAQ